MVRDLEKYQRQKREMSRKSSDTWKPSEGTNLIRVFLFPHKVTKSDVQEGFFKKEQEGKVFDELSRPLVRQFGLNESNVPIFATEETLAKYDELAKIAEETEDENDEANAKAIRPDKKYLLNIVDLNDVEKGVQIYMAAPSVYTRILDVYADEESGEDAFGPKGVDFKIEMDSKVKNKKDYYKVLTRDSKHCKPLPAQLEEKVHDFYDEKIYGAFAADYEEMLARDKNGGNSKGDDEGGFVETPKAKENGKGKKKAAEPTVKGGKKPGKKPVDPEELFK